MSTKSIKRRENNTNLWTMSMSDFPKDKDGLIYVRQSSLVQVRNNIHSFEMQTDRFLEHFRNMGCTGNIEVVADDEAMSGTLDIHERPGMTRMVKLIEEERVGWIGAIHVNRFTRDPWLITPAVLMKKCFDHQVWIATLRMNFNFEDEYCQRVFMLEAEEAARHLKWMKLVLGGAKSTASDNGYYDGRFLVPGYIVDRTDPKRKKYIPYRPHAEIVFWLFKHFLELDGNLAQLCKEIEHMPYLFPKFESWVDGRNISRFRIKEIMDGAYAGNYKPGRGGIESILTNPVYIGWWLPLDGGVIEHNHEPIVNEGLFTYAHKRVSTHDLQGERQKPERVSRWGEVNALLRKVIKDDEGRTIYVSPEKGGTYRATNDAGLRHNYNFSVLVRTLDPLFLDRFLERVESIDPARFNDWADQLDEEREAKKKREERREQLIKEQIADAKRKWQESMGVLKNPNIPKTEQMQIDLANECAGLEGKIAKLQKDLNHTAKEEEEENEILYLIYTILPELRQKWDKLPFVHRMTFVGALVRRVVLSHPVPGWLKIEIEWKFPEWGIDTRYIRRTTSNGSGWSEEEDQKFGDMYPSADALELLNAFPERTWMALRRRAETLGITRKVENDMPTRGIHAHHCIRDIEFLEKAGKLSMGVKGMDRIISSTCLSDNLNTWIGSL